MNKKQKFSLLAAFAAMASTSRAAVDPAFTSTATALQDSLGEYVTALLPIVGECLVVVFAFVGLWTVFRVVRRVLSSAG